MSNLLIMHGGGPTAVINASLYGALQEAKRAGVARVYGARGGTGGFLREDLIDLGALSDSAALGLLKTPGSAIGTSRDALETDDYERMAELCLKHDIRAVLLNGGNGSMDTCGKLWKHCKDKGIAVMGIPKTMDNDLSVTDHSPGFGSAARYMAASVAELCVDVHSLPIHVVVIESLGRNAGWLTAASGLADDTGFGPDLIYVPELAFDEEAFLRDVKALIAHKGHGVVVASEGLKNADGSPIVPPVFQSGRSTYFGDVSAHLAQLITRQLGYKARSEKPGLLSRCSMSVLSETDRDEAILAGELACRAALAGEGGQMIGFRRLPGPDYRIEAFQIPVEQVMLEEKTLPLSYLNAAGNGVTEAFKDWCRPLLGAPLPQMLKLG